MNARLFLFLALASLIVGMLVAPAILPVAHPRSAALADTPIPDLTDETQARKTVPILSLGSGLRVGLAMVGGPDTQVSKVNAVAQIEGDWKGARIRALVPIDTEGLKELHRVPETSVIGYADIKL
jgi:hypothetical protein